MDNRKWEADAIASPPTAPASPSDGYPTNGNPQTAQNATEPGAWWFHAVGEELRAVIEAGGLTPDIDDLTQLQAAIAAQISANIVTVPDATETVKGKVEKATAAEAQAFTADKYIDGERLASAFQGSNHSLAVNGYQKLPSGLIIQWGTISTPVNTATSFTFPIAFPSQASVVLVTGLQNNSDVNGELIYLQSKSASGATILNGNNNITQTEYIAIGY